MSAALLKIASDAKAKSISEEEAKLQHFQNLRMEQRKIAIKLTEMDVADSELALVISTLDKAEPSRKCYRLMGMVLCEKTVKETLPELYAKKKEIHESIATLKDELAKKGAELNEYRIKNGITVGPSSHFIK